MRRRNGKNKRREENTAYLKLGSVTTTMEVQISYPGNKVRIEKSQSLNQ